MTPTQPGAPAAAAQTGASPQPAAQMQAALPRSPRPAPTPAAFGTGGGAAIVFRDYASI